MDLALPSAKLEVFSGIVEPAVRFDDFFQGTEHADCPHTNLQASSLLQMVIK